MADDGGIFDCTRALKLKDSSYSAGLGDLRDSHDPNCTYEGENHILMQQTSNWLVTFWLLVLKGRKIATPLGSLAFLNESQQILTWKFSARSVEEIIEPTNILNTFKWLICYLFKFTCEKYEQLLSSTSSSASNRAFLAKNDSQVFYAKNLAIVYIQHIILQKMYDKIAEISDIQITIVLRQLLIVLFGVWCLEMNMQTLYAGGYASGPDAANLIQDSILKLCSAIKNDAVALVDAIAPADFALNSVLGYADGQVYKHLEAAMLRSPGALSRPYWWREIAYTKKSVRAKL